MISIKTEKSAEESSEEDDSDHPDHHPLANQKHFFLVHNLEFCWLSNSSVSLLI